MERRLEEQPTGTEPPPEGQEPSLEPRATEMHPEAERRTQEATDNEPQPEGQEPQKDPTEEASDTEPRTEEQESERTPQESTEEVTESSFEEGDSSDQSKKLRFEKHDVSSSSESAEDSSDQPSASKKQQRETRRKRKSRRVPVHTPESPRKRQAEQPGPSRAGRHASQALTPPKRRKRSRELPMSVKDLIKKFETPPPKTTRVLPPTRLELQRSRSGSCIEVTREAREQRAGQSPGKQMETTEPAKHATSDPSLPRALEKEFEESTLLQATKAKLPTTPQLREIFRQRTTPVIEVSEDTSSPQLEIETPETATASTGTEISVPQASGSKSPTKRRDLPQTEVSPPKKYKPQTLTVPVHGQPAKLFKRQHKKAESPLKQLLRKTKPRPLDIPSTSTEDITRSLPEMMERVGISSGSRTSSESSQSPVSPFLPPALPSPITATVTQESAQMSTAVATSVRVRDHPLPERRESESELEPSPDQEVPEEVGSGSESSARDSTSDLGSSEIGSSRGMSPTLSESSSHRFSSEYLQYGLQPFVNIHGVNVSSEAFIDLPSFSGAGVQQGQERLPPREMPSPSLSAPSPDFSFYSRNIRTPGGSSSDGLPSHLPDRATPESSEGIPALSEPMFGLPRTSSGSASGEDTRSSFSATRRHPQGPTEESQSRTGAAGAFRDRSVSLDSYMAEGQARTSAEYEEPTGIPTRMSVESEGAAAASPLLGSGGSDHSADLHRMSIESRRVSIDSILSGDVPSGRMNPLADVSSAESEQAMSLESVPSADQSAADSAQPGPSGVQPAVESVSSPDQHKSSDDSGLFAAYYGRSSVEEQESLPEEPSVSAASGSGGKGDSGGFSEVQDIPEASEEEEEDLESSTHKPAPSAAKRGSPSSEPGPSRKRKLHGTEEGEEKEASDDKERKSELEKSSSSRGFAEVETADGERKSELEKEKSSKDEEPATKTEVEETEEVKDEESSEKDITSGSKDESTTEEPGTLSTELEELGEETGTDEKLTASMENE